MNVLRQQIRTSVLHNRFGFGVLFGWVGLFVCFFLSLFLLSRVFLLCLCSVVGIVKKDVVSFLTWKNCEMVALN